MSYTLNRVAVGQVGVLPGSVKMITTDSLATITTAGYLNGVGNQLPTVEVAPSDVIECLYGYNSVTDAGTLAFFQPSISNGVITLNLWENPGNVLLPVVNGDFAVFNGTTGQIKDAGYSASDPTKTKVVMATATTTVGYISHFTDVAGTIGNTAGAVTNPGDIYAGLSGTAGVLRSYPATANTGYLGLTGVANSGAFNVQISNASHTQSTVYSIADIGAATGGLVSATTAIRMKTVSAAAAAGGAAAQSFTDAFCTTGSVIVGNWNTQANAASVLTIVPGNGSFVVTSSANAGVGTFNYIITK